MRTFAAIFVTFLPKSLRDRLGFHRTDPYTHYGVLISAALQIVTCLSIFTWHYLHFMSERLGVLVAKGGIGSEHVQFGMGITVYLEFLLLSPLTWCLGYFGCEGGVRILAALVTGEVVGSGPLKLVEVGYLYARDRLRQQKLPPLVEDAFETTGPDFYTVSSCRDKQWDLSTAVRIEGRLFEVSEISAGDNARPFVYHLRPYPEGKLVRKLRDYEAVLDATRPSLSR